MSLDNLTFLNNLSKFQPTNSWELSSNGNNNYYFKPTEGLFSQFTRCLKNENLIFRAASIVITREFELNNDSVGTMNPFLTTVIYRLYNVGLRAFDQAYPNNVELIKLKKKISQLDEVYHFLEIKVYTEARLILELEKHYETSPISEDNKVINQSIIKGLAGKTPIDQLPHLDLKAVLLEINKP